MFSFQSGIPAPTIERVRSKGEFKLSVEAVPVGESFFAPGRTAKASYTTLSKKNNPGKEFKVMDVTEDVTGADGTVTPTKGVRVWRIA